MLIFINPSDEGKKVEITWGKSTDSEDFAVLQIVAPRNMWVPILFLFVFPSKIYGSPFDPHVPDNSPWFEGWYTRVTSADSSASYGLIVGHYPEQKYNNSAYAAILYQQADLKRALVEFRTYPESLSVSGKDGRQILQNPTDEAEPNFAISASDSSFTMKTEGENTHISASIAQASGVVSLEFIISGPSNFWGQKGEGPEGWASKIPFIGLHWFVYSLSSPAKYRLQFPNGKVESGNGWAHMEKNWGTSFPSGWIWAEGMELQNGKPRSIFAVAGGVAIIAGADVPNQYLIGYRSPLLNWNFRPQDPSVFTTERNPCNGTFSLKARSPTQFIEILISAPTNSFGSVSGPTKAGFIVDSVESFSATATISAYRANPLNPFSPGTLVERKEFQDVALEFGGNYQCKEAIA